MRGFSSSMSRVRLRTVRARSFRRSSAPATSSSPMTRRRCQRASPASICRPGRRGGAARWTRFAATPGRDPLHRSCVRRRRLSDADRAPAAPRRPAPRRPTAAGSAACDGALGAGTSATDRDPLRRQVGGHLGRSGPPRPPDSVPRTCRSRWRSGTTWTRFAGLPVAFEAPSAGFILDWAAIGVAPRARGGLRHASPTRQASRRRATPSSIGCCRSTSRTTSRLPRRR